MMTWYHLCALLFLLSVAQLSTGAIKKSHYKFCMHCSFPFMFLYILINSPTSQLSGICDWNSGNWLNCACLIYVFELNINLLCCRLLPCYFKRNTIGCDNVLNCTVYNIAKMKWSEEQCLLLLWFRTAPVQRSIKSGFHLASRLLT